MKRYHPADHIAASTLAWHGGRVDAAARCFPDAPAPWIDLSTGINPWAWPIDHIPVPDCRALPSEAENAALCFDAARSFGAGSLPLAALPGSEIGLRMLPRLPLPLPWRVVVPTYRTHQAALPGSTAITADELDEEALRGGTILLGNPNNPDGRLIAGERMVEIARALAARGGVLVVDEAFVETVPQASVLPYLTVDDRALVFRSFGKFFGLAGVRLGFACGSGVLVERLAEMLGSWPVSAQALVCGRAAYADHRWAEATRARLRAASDGLDALLERHELRASGSCPLFRLVEHADALAIFERLARAGLLVRPFDYRPSCLRFGLPADARAMERLDAALAHR